MIFGWAGLALSLVALCHAAYQLNRQVSQAAGSGSCYGSTETVPRFAQQFLQKIFD